MDGDRGPLGPDSVAWRLHASPAMLTAGLRALLLQLWHPSIASAVAAHSEVARDPWRRYQATVEFITGVTYGEREDADAAIRRVKGVHDSVRGIDIRGVSYSATDPALLAYVHATLVDSALRAADVYGPRLPPDERDRYVVEMARVAVLLGVEDPPRDAQSARCGHRRQHRRVRDPARTRSRRGSSRCRHSRSGCAPAYGVLFASAVDLLPRGVRRRLRSPSRMEPGPARGARLERGDAPDREPRGRAGARRAARRHSVARRNFAAP